MFHVFTRCDTVSFLVVEVKKCMHGKLGKHIQMSLQYSVLLRLQDQHWQPLTYDWKEWRGSRICFMIASAARCLSMMLECNYLLREDKQLMHECHQQKLHLCNIIITRVAYVPSWSLLHGLKQQYLLLQSYHHVPSEWGWNKSTDGGCMGSSLDNSTRGYTSLQRTDMMWLQERLQRMLQVSESYSQVHCTLLLWCNDWF